MNKQQEYKQILQRLKEVDIVATVTVINFAVKPRTNGTTFTEPHRGVLVQDRVIVTPNDYSLVAECPLCDVYAGPPMALGDTIWTHSYVHARSAQAVTLIYLHGDYNTQLRSWGVSIASSEEEQYDKADGKLRALHRAVDKLYGRNAKLFWRDYRAPRKRKGYAKHSKEYLKEPWVEPLEDRQWKEVIKQV